MNHATPIRSGRVAHGDPFIRPDGRARSGRGPRPLIHPILGVVFALLLLPAGALGQDVDKTLWIADGPVRSVVTDGHTVYIGGDFTHVGPATGSAAGTWGVISGRCADSRARTSPTWMPTET